MTQAYENNTQLASTLEPTSQPQACASVMDALKLAASRGDELQIRRLVMTITDTSLRDSATLDTPLHVLASLSDPRPIDMLLARGFNPAARNINGWYPHHFAAVYDRVEPMARLVQATDDSDLTDFNGATPLHFATQYRAINTARWLLDAGADPSARDCNADTPLHFAAMSGAPPSLVQALLEAGANPDALDHCRDTPLHIAVEYNRIQMVRALLRARCNVNAINLDGRTPDAMPPVYPSICNDEGVFLVGHSRYVRQAFDRRSAAT
ncbi:ankyrin repeat domain-containing protein [Salinisphaera sp. P385]|uniref:Ankyrin repeat domain-containing protein n=1 Tax=Spectribacter acetivorans TaxID=3075603 RepID=A0ABU3B7V8_9GAMM|nr:ankyrin repeat domain-containing protein [Salinisphaera sp. P385]MDT0618536.1 ankyrin repeat domain-containing protein [Salinisphaera sp. P385]